MTASPVPPHLNLDFIENTSPEELRKLEDQYRDALRPMIEAAASLPAMLRSMQSASTGVLRTIHSTTGTIQGIGRAVERSTELLRERIASIVQQGWFIDEDMTLVSVRELERAFSSGQFSTAEKILIDYYRGAGEDIVARVCSKAPHRAGLIRDAWGAHKDGKYTLSIPVLLLQADGIVADRRKGRQLFSKSPEKSIAGLIKAAPKGSSDWVFLAAYEKDSPFSKNTDQLPKGFDGLNRHEVLHGLSTSYASEVNSLRALSALGYVDFVLAPAVTE